MVDSNIGSMGWDLITELSLNLASVLLGVLVFLSHSSLQLSAFF